MISRPEIIGLSHIGQRDENQDRYCLLVSDDHREILVVVADGMGGHKNGAVAAEAIINVAQKLWRSRSDEQTIEQFLESLVSTAHTEINTIAAEQDIDTRSTLAALYFAPNQIASIHVGDSRIIQFSDQGFVRRTIDHSVAQLHVLSHKIQEYEMATHPDQNKLTTSMGGPDAPEYEIEQWDITEGSNFVVCSDGFWELFAPDEIYTLVNGQISETELNIQVEAKLQTTSDHDNITVAFLRGKPIFTTKQNSNQMASPNGRLPWHIITTLAIALLVVLALVCKQYGQTEMDTILPEKGGSFDGDPNLNAEHNINERRLLAPVNIHVSNSKGKSTQEFELTDTEKSSGQVESSQPTKSTQMKESGEPAETEPSSDPNQEAIDYIETSPSTKSDSEKNFELPDIDGGQSIEGPSLEPGDTIGVEDNHIEDKIVEINKPSPAPLSSVDESLNLPVSSKSQVRAKVEQKLKSEGRLSDNDQLITLKESDTIANVTIVRLQQRYKKIPVIGAELVVSISGREITNLNGKIAERIELAATERLSYLAAIAAARKITGADISPQDEGEKIIFKTTDGYLLCWRGNTIMDSGVRSIILSASDGTILESVPGAIDKKG